MPKITILKQYVTFSNAYNFVEYSYENAVRNAEFQEVTDQELSDLIKIVNELNKKTNGFGYIIIECPNQEEIKYELIENLKVFLEEQKIKLENDKKRILEEEKLKKEKQLERKRKQLEKLKKELE